MDLHKSPAVFLWGSVEGKRVGKVKTRINGWTYAPRAIFLWRWVKGGGACRESETRMNGCTHTSPTPPLPRIIYVGILTTHAPFRFETGEPFLEPFLLPICGHTPSRSTEHFWRRWALYFQCLDLDLAKGERQPGMRMEEGGGGVGNRMMKQESPPKGFDCCVRVCVLLWREMKTRAKYIFLRLVGRSCDGYYPGRVLSGGNGKVRQVVAKLSTPSVGGRLTIFIRHHRENQAPFLSIPRWLFFSERRREGTVSEL
ncbi:unnamed protein product [Pylaiella littoralis]